MLKIFCHIVRNLSNLLPGELGKEEDSLSPVNSKQTTAKLLPGKYTEVTGALLSKIT